MGLSLEGEPSLYKRGTDRNTGERKMDGEEDEAER